MRLEDARAMVYDMPLQVISKQISPRTTRLQSLCRAPCKYRGRHTGDTVTISTLNVNEGSVHGQRRRWRMDGWTIGVALTRTGHIPCSGLRARATFAARNGFATSFGRDLAQAGSVAMNARSTLVVENRWISWMLEHVDATMMQDCNTRGPPQVEAGKSGTRSNIHPVISVAPWASGVGSFHGRKCGDLA